MTKRKHPMQPVVLTDRGIVRFKVNNIINHLFETGAIDLNKIISGGLSRRGLQPAHAATGILSLGIRLTINVQQGAPRKSRTRERALDGKHE